MSDPATHSWQLWRDRRGRLSVLRLATLALLLMPLTKAVFEAGDIAHGARPLNELIHRAGFWALVFLGVTLAVTPFRRIFRYGNLIDVRRMLGVGTFCYIVEHLALFFADQSYSFGKLFHEITHRVYLIIGAIAWLGLAALAAPASGDLRDRTAWADPLFPTDQGRRNRSDFRRQPVFMADWLSRARLVAGHERAFDREPLRPHDRRLAAHVCGGGDWHRHRVSRFAAARARYGVRFRRRHQAGMAGARGRTDCCRH